ncbi:MAG: hypothetical protein ACYC6N_10310 [Pirellulaceae bacterium]
MHTVHFAGLGSTSILERLGTSSVGWAVAAAIILLLLLFVAIRILRRKRDADRQPLPDLFVDVGRLDSSGPPAAGPRAEFYGLPVRLAVVVLAPAGRQGELPPAEVLPGLMDRLVPGLSGILASHNPMMCRWPAQLSSQGFAQRFFNQVALPGDRGKGTPWCSIAGRLKVGDRLFLIGMLCCAHQPNGLSQVVVHHEGQWLDILRIRDE